MRNRWAFLECSQHCKNISQILLHIPDQPGNWGWSTEADNGNRQRWQDLSVKHLHRQRRLAARCSCLLWRRLPSAAGGRRPRSAPYRRQPARVAPGEVSWKLSGLSKGTFHLRFSGIRPLRGYPPPTPLTENQCEKKKDFFLSGKGGVPPPLTENPQKKF